MSGRKTEIDNLAGNLSGSINNLAGNLSGSINNLAGNLSGSINNLQKNQNGLQDQINNNRETLKIHEGLVTKNISDISEIKNPPPLFVNEGETFELHGRSWSDKVTYTLKSFLVINGGTINVSNVKFVKDPLTTEPVGIIILSNGTDKNFDDFNDYPPLKDIKYGSVQGSGNKMIDCDLIDLGDNNKDLNALTLVNLGTDNMFNSISVKNSGDDGIEIFGGSVNMTNITIEDAQDDFFDTDDGHTGTILGLTLIVSDKIEKSLIECGNSGPTTTTKFLDVNVIINQSTETGDLSSFRESGNTDYVFNFKDGTECVLNGEPQNSTSNILPDNKVLFISENMKYELSGDHLSYKEKHLNNLIVVKGGNLNFRNLKLTKPKNTQHPVGIIILAAGNDYNFTDFSGVPGLENIPYGISGSGNTMVNCDLIDLGDNDKDINALTLVNLSTDNLFKNIHVKNSGDDGIEIFGGSVNMTNITIEDAQDDFFDTDDGHTGTISGLTLIVSDKIEKSLIECGNSGPTTTTEFSNVNVKINKKYKTGDLSSFRESGNTDFVFNFKAPGTNIKLNGEQHTSPTNTIKS